MEQLTLVFLLVLATIVAVPLAERLRLPYPILVTVAGLGLALVPGIPDLEIAPDLLLPLLLPPLLYAAARRTTWAQFRVNGRPIVLLAVALVLVTTAAVAAVATGVDPALPVAAAVVLGAVVAPPDPVAASAVASTLRLPRRMVSILEGEGLFNDVAALVLYQVAVQAVVTGSFSPSEALLQLVTSTAIGAGLGLALGYAARWAVRTLADATVQSAVSLLVPFAAYVLAEELHGSGILAVLVTALLLSSPGANSEDAEGRLAGLVFWDVLELLVTGLAFGIVGFQLREVLAAATADRARLAVESLLVVLVVVGVRAAWLFPITAIARRMHRPERNEDAPSSVRETVVMWWAGMRGVVTVALALALPTETEDGSPFPGRDSIIVVAFVVVLVTLVLQGLTLPTVVRRLGVQDPEGLAVAEKEVALRAAQAALDRLDELERERDDLTGELMEVLRGRQVAMFAHLDPEHFDDAVRDAARARGGAIATRREVEGEMIVAAREAVLQARTEAGVDPEAADRVLRRLDLRSML